MTDRRTKTSRTLQMGSTYDAVSRDWCVFRLFQQRSRFVVEMKISDVFLYFFAVINDSGEIVTIGIFFIII